MNKRRIKQNLWGNWYGYEGRKRVIEFMNSPVSTQEQEAKLWLSGKPPEEQPTFTMTFRRAQ